MFLYSILRLAHYGKYFVSPLKIDDQDPFFSSAAFIYQCLCESRTVQWNAFRFEHIAHFVLSFLDNLPEPLLTFDLHDQFISATSTHF